MAMKRRTLLEAAAILALAGPFAAAAEGEMKAAEGAPPTLKAPPHAADCHMHIYDSRFPVAANAVLLPPDAHVADYRGVQKRLGTTRTVVVQPSTYGTDNRCMLDALASFGGDARGIAVVDTGVSDEELMRLAGVGVRGIRFNLVQAGTTTADMIEPLSKRVADLGWHVQLHMKGDQIAAIEEVLLRLPLPLVLDHMGRIPPGPGAGTSHPAFAAVQRLIDKGRTWVKLSGAYIDTKVGPPGYSDTSEIAKALVRYAPERLVWGSDWPHPTERANKPDDAVLFDLVAEWIPDAETQRQILVANPEALYGFTKAS
jgi:D-galactarolactone isomerase